MAENRFGFKDSHHLVEERVPPPELIAFRTELARHTDIYAEAQTGRSFEESIALVAARLNIVMDGMYEVPQLCAMLTTALQNRHINASSPELNAPGLIRVELIEKLDSMSIDEILEEEPTMIGAAYNKPGTVTAEGRFVVCDSCKTTYDCIENRSCGGRIH